MSRKKSNDEKKQQGTLKKSRSKRIKAHIAENWPKPDIDLSDEEQVIYASLCRHLEAAESLFDADAHLLTQVAVNISMGVTAMKKLRDAGPIQYFDNGTRNVSPEWSIFEKACNLFRQHSKMLGLDPRSRLDMEYFLNATEEEVDPAAKFLKAVN